MASVACLTIPAVVASLTDRGFQRTATRETPGSNSFINASCLEISSGRRNVVPVMSVLHRIAHRGAQKASGPSVTDVGINAKVD